MNGKRAVLACIFLAGWATGCGYSTQSTLDQRYQTIAVPAFKNLSKEYDFQAPLTNAVIRKFMADSRLEVTPLDKADLILEGVVLDYRRKGLTYDRNDEVTQFLCFVT
ncbi:MAG: LptE family protein, partial [Candidatus Hydrogenedentota bacterium]